MAAASEDKELVDRSCLLQALAEVRLNCLAFFLASLTRAA